MESKSLNQLKKHVKLCKKCQSAQNTRQLCGHIQKFATQDYARQKEQPLSPDIIDHVYFDPWTEGISDTADEETQNLIQEKLALLNPTDRQIIELRYWEGKTLREIASILGFKSDNAVRKRLQKAQLALKNSMTSENENPNSFQAVIEKGAHIASIGEGGKDESN